MIDQEKFINILQAEGVGFFTGVPDSFLNGFCNYLLKKMSAEKHVIAANEGNAVAIAAGHYFAAGDIPLVYLQNSGMGNMVNPLVSLVDKYVYGVPMILLIGWRGEPGTELKHPQHKTQGAITLKLLELLEIPYVIAENNDEKLEEQAKWAVHTAATERIPVAIIGRKGVFAENSKENIVDMKYPLSRQEAIEITIDTLPKDTVYAATTGRATRELYFLREKRIQDHYHDFLNLGSMGHASSVALGMALTEKNRRVVCLDGDAAALMHMGSFTMVSKLKVPNFMHIILNNGAHESVGGQPSAGQLVNFTQIAQGCGYETIGKEVTTKQELVLALEKLLQCNCATFLDVRIHKGLDGKLPPLDISASGLINGLMQEMQKKENEK